MNKKNIFYIEKLENSLYNFFILKSLLFHFFRCILLSQIKKIFKFVNMKLTQEQIDQATIKIEAHLKDIGILNNYTLLSIDELNENVRLFIYQISTPLFKTIIQVEYDFEKENSQSDTAPSFSWMDYKKITE